MPSAAARASAGMRQSAGALDAETLMRFFAKGHAKFDDVGKDGAGREGRARSPSAERRAS